MRLYAIAGTAVVLLAVLLILALQVNTAEPVDTNRVMYAWKDKDGQIKITNTKPPEGATIIKVIELKTEEPDTDVTEDSVKTVRPSAAPDPEVTGSDTVSTTPKVELYSTSWCLYCKKARQFLKDNTIEYVEYDIEKSRDGKARYDKHGGQGVPLIVVDGQVIHGFNVPKLKELLKL